MSIGSVLFGGALLLLSAVALLDPFKRKGSTPRQADEEPADPEARYQASLNAIGDLDFDYRTGKLDSADYQAVRRQLMFEAAQWLERAEGDRLQVLPGAGPGIPARRSPDMDRNACPHCGANLARSSRYCPQCGSLLERTCANCGEELDQADQHCAACGEPVPARIGVEQ